MLGKLKNIKKENLYLAAALTLGLVMAIFNPPFAGVPDEHAHYWKSWSVANGFLRCTGHDYIPKTAQELPDAIKPVSIDNIKGKKIIVRRLEDFLFMKDNDETAIIGGAACPGTPFGYFPQVLGLRLGKALGLSALADFYLARIFVLFASVLVVYWAICIVPFGKIIFLLVGLLPLTIRQFSSVSYDALAIAFAMLFLAYVLKLATDKNTLITKKNIASLFLLSLFGLNVKMGYFVMSFLVFLLPQTKFKNKKQYWIFIIGFVLVNIILFLFYRNFFIDIATPNYTDPAAQMSFVLHNPIHFMYIAIQSFYGADGPFFPFMESIFFKTGAGKSVPFWFYILTLIGFIFFLKNTDEKVELSTKQRLIMLAVFLANFFIIYLALYVGWSKVGADKVSGVQGRYFLVIVPLFIFTFYKANIRWTYDFIKRNFNVIFIAFLITIFLTAYFGIYRDLYDKSKKGKSVYQEYLENQ